MGDAISNTRKEITRTSDVGASPIIFIIAIFAIIGIGIYFFKDKIFKNKSKPQVEDKGESPETLQEPQASKINDKFAELNN